MPDVEANERELCERSTEIVRATPPLMGVLSVARNLCLPDWLVFSGAVYQPVFNRLTGRPLDYGIKDYDLAYFDASDLSHEFEDAVIRRVKAAFDEPLGRHYVTASDAIYDARLATLWELPERPDHSIPMRAAAGAIRAGIHQKLVGGFNCRLGRKGSKGRHCPSCGRKALSDPDVLETDWDCLAVRHCPLFSVLGGSITTEI
jgi:hypothetical protein